jgi:NAD(P)-dependent dehydrogenase (short-subunit alcohol dehydrogenase family)
MNKIGLNDDLEKYLVSTIPLARMGKPEEVADMITYLSGDNASFITVSIFSVDGGQSI